MRPLLRTLGRVATLLVGPVAALAALDLAAAATPRDWVFTQQVKLSGHSATYCYDPGSLRREALLIRVRVKSNVANHELAEDCRTLTGGADGITFEGEILIRCRDRKWAQTEDSGRHRIPEPLPEEQWRTSRGGQYHNMVDQLCAVAPRPRDRPNEATGGASSGSGFFVDKAGHILTNYHVVGNCTHVSVVAADKRLRADVVARDPTLDLALLKAATVTTAYATFRAAAPPRAGETVIAAGFPLRGLLASGPIVSTGIVNAVSGIRDDTTRFQISAPVQPGNSGGPLLDASGNVIGVVVSKLDAVKLAQATGDMPQNVNFAIKGDSARVFLEKNGITPRTGTWTRAIDAVGVAAIAKSMTVPVDCK